MDQRGAADQRRVHPGDHEGRRGDPAADLQPLAEALGERGLAGPEVPGQDHQVTGAQHRGQPCAEGAGLLGGGGLLLHGQRLRHGHRGALPGQLVVAEVAPEPDRPRQLGARGEPEPGVPALPGHPLGGADQRAGHAHPLGVGVHRDPAQAEQVAAGLEEQRPDRPPTGLREQPAVVGEDAGDALLGLVGGRSRAGRAGCGRRSRRGSPTTSAARSAPTSCTATAPLTREPASASGPPTRSSYRSVRPVMPTASRAGGRRPRRPSAPGRR